MESNPFSLGLVNDPLQPIDQVLLVFVAFKHIKCGEYKLILILDQLLQNQHIVWILEMFAGKTIDEVHQLLLALWQWTLGSLKVWIQLLSKSGEFVT